MASGIRAKPSPIGLYEYNQLTTKTSKKYCYKHVLYISNVLNLTLPSLLAFMRKMFYDTTLDFIYCFEAHSCYLSNVCLLPLT